MSSTENSEQTTELPHLQTVRDIIRWSYNHGRLKGEFPDTDVGLKVVLDSAEALIASMVDEARKQGRKDIAEKAVQHKERADFFKPETEVMLVSSLVWLASLQSKWDNNNGL